MKKRGQISVWVIIVIVLVASIVLCFLIYQNPTLIKSSEYSESLEIQSYLQSCAKEYVDEAVEVMLPHGGFVSPKNTVYFDGIAIEYICLNNGQFSPCINQHPMLLNEMKNEIDKYVSPKIENCFEKMRADFRRAGSNVEFVGGYDMKVDMKEDKIILFFEREVIVMSKEETRRTREIKLEIPSPAYNLAVIAMEIASQEANYCYFEYVGYNIIYPRYEIKKYTMSDATGIYRIIDLESNKQMNIAVKSCSIRPGGG